MRISGPLLTLAAVAAVASGTVTANVLLTAAPGQVPTAQPVGAAPARPDAPAPAAGGAACTGPSPDAARAGGS